MRKSLLILLVLALPAWGCAYEAVGSTTEAATGSVHDCNVTGDGVFASGDVFSGVASDILGVEDIEWAHDTPAWGMDTVQADLDGIECRLNGGTTADFVGNGTATVNGTPGYSYFIEIADNRPAPEEVCTDDCDDGEGCRRGRGRGHDRARGRGHHSHGNGHGRGHDRHHCEETCTTVPAPGTPDSYSIIIGDPSGGIFYSFSGNVEDGDISIELLP